MGLCAHQVVGDEAFSDQLSALDRKFSLMTFRNFFPLTFKGDSTIS
jgi:hypothetical protein